MRLQVPTVRAGFSFRLFASMAIASVSISEAAAKSPLFLPGHVVGRIELPAIDEASGLVASRTNDDVFWVHNDSGDAARVYALNSVGDYLGQFLLHRTSSEDWEDMAIGADPISGDSYLYLGDIGDNSGRRPTIQVHRVAEPIVDSHQTPLGTRLSGVETFTFQYPDGPRDAETLLVDPTNGDIYIVSKRDAVPRIYRAAYPQSTSDIVTLEAVGRLKWAANSSADWPTGGDISPDGGEVLIRSRVGVTLWKTAGAATISDSLSMRGHYMPLAFERQGEAIGFSADGIDFYSVSEGSRPPIYRYTRVPEPTSLATSLAALVSLLLLRRRRRS